MKFTTKRTLTLLCLLLALLTALIGAIVLFERSYGNTTASAADDVESDDKISNLQAESTDKLTFTPITDENDVVTYKVAIKTSFRSSAQTIIVPKSYNGIEVTEIADNGFTSCVKLEKVILPISVKVIGNNAFMNCSKLEHLGIPAVERIGNNAFARCTLLDGLYIPHTVQSVGSYVLRNNANRVYVQSSADAVNATWDSTWSTYFTGETVYSVDPTDMIQYREVMDEQGESVIGYELTEYQPLYSEDDIVIYNSVLVDEDIGYLPVLNICSEAFTFASANSIAIRDRHADDPTAPVFDHQINIRSNAFLCSFITEEIVFEVGVSFNQPEELAVEPTSSMFDGEPIVGDGEGRSARVFEMSTMTSISLPADMTVIPKAMFKDCAYLAEIRFAGENYDGTNKLFNIIKIGDSAFSSCSDLSNITIGNSVMSMGESVFYLWGDSKDQEINIDFYENELPAEWHANWADGITDRAVLNYKTPIQVTFDWQTESGKVEVLSFKLGNAMPIPQMPTQAGYVFKGFYTEKNGCGIQYYTNSLESVRVWQEGDALTLYAYWVSGNFTATLDDGVNTRTIPVSFGVAMPAVSMPEKNGYAFKGYYFQEQDGSETYYYNANMGSERDWDRDSDATLTAKWEIISYKITYLNVTEAENPSSNPKEYTIVSPTITFAEPTGRRGYSGEWNLDQIPAGSTGDVTVNAVWTAEKYKITYKEVEVGENPSSNPTEYTIESPKIVFAVPVRTGFTGSWNISEIPSGSTGNLEITAIWDSIDYSISYLNLQGGTNPNTVSSYRITDATIVFENPTGRLGYIGEWDIKSIPSGSTGDVTVTAVWQLIEYNIEFVYQPWGQSNWEICKEQDYNVKKGTLALTDPNISGYKFFGWYKNSEFNSACTSLSYSDFENLGGDTLTLYAKTSAYVNISFRDEKHSYQNKTEQHYLGEVITLPNPGAITNYTGTWRYGYNHYVFGSQFTVELKNGETSLSNGIVLEVSWIGDSFTITYHNLTDPYTGSRAVCFSAQSYTYGTETWLQDPYFVGNHPNQKSDAWEFVGWYTSNNFLANEKISIISSYTSGNLNFYAKWIWTACSIGQSWSGDGKIITDKGFDSNVSVTNGTRIGNLSVEEINKLGFTSAKIVFTFTYKEKDDGYQQVQILNSSGKNLTGGTMEYEAEAKEVKTVTITCDVSLEDISGNSEIIVQFSARGFGSDDWYLQSCRFTLIYS